MSSHRHDSPSINEAGASPAAGEDKKNPQVFTQRGNDGSDTEYGTAEESERAASFAAALVEAEPKKTWRSYVWDTFDKSPEERWFLTKLDAAILSLACFGYFIKYLDQVNVSNAFTSGMQEDLGLWGNELTYMTTFWTVGYVIGGIPSNMLLTRIRPSILVPACEVRTYYHVPFFVYVLCQLFANSLSHKQVTWSILTIIMCKCTSAKQIYALRFLIGLAESGFYPGMQYIIGSWYRRDELAKRSCIFHTSSSLGQMFSGYLMAAVYNLDGKNGFAGWQWLFIVNTIISLPIAMCGFFIFPDLPEISRAWYLTKEEIELARRRMDLEGRAKRGPYTKKKFAKIFTSWHIYLLTLLYIWFNNGNSFGSQPAFALWLKSEGYSLTQYNTYPTISNAVTVITTLIYAWSSDTIFRGARWPPIVFSGLVKLIVYPGLAVWDIPNSFKWACFIMEGFGGGISGLCFSWAHEICSEDNEERALVVGTMNEMAYVVQAWLPLLVWQTLDAPEYHKGMVTMIAFAICLILNAFAVRWLHKRQIKKKEKAEVVVAGDA